MVSFNVTYLHCLQHFFFEHRFNLYPLTIFFILYILFYILLTGLNSLWFISIFYFFYFLQQLLKAGTWDSPVIKSYQGPI